jgi:NADH-quinone oxidoreductase subunit J
MSKIAFYIVSFLSIYSALMVVLTRKPVYSVLYLIFCFFTIAGHYILLNAQFLAAVHVIVYAGAIMVLFLFVIMLLNLNAESEPHKNIRLKFAATVTGGTLLLVLLASLKTFKNIPGQISSAAQIGLVKNLGNALFNQYMLPFEVLALLFLSAMVGAVMLAKKEIK